MSPARYRALSHSLRSGRALAGDFAEGDTASVDHGDGEYTFEKTAAPAKSKAKAAS